MWCTFFSDSLTKVDKKLRRSDPNRSPSRKIGREKDYSGISYLRFNLDRGILEVKEFRTREDVRVIVTSHSLVLLWRLIIL